jgi:hypothetical protein
MITIKEHEQLITEAVHLLTSPMSVDHDLFRNAIKSFSPETLNRITGFGLVDWQKAELCGGLTIYGWDESFTNDYLSMSHVGVSTLYDIDKNLDALKFYEGMTQQSGNNYPSERAEQIAAVATVLLHMQDRGDNMLVPFKDDESWKSLPYINYAALRNLLVDSPHRNAVVKIVTERDITDADMIVTMLESGSPALIEGAL